MADIKRNPQAALQSALGLKPAVRVPALAWVLSALAVLLIAALSVLAARTNYFPFELNFSLAVQQLQSPLLDRASLIIDWFGYVPQMPILTVVLGLIFFVARYRWEGVVTVLALLVEATIDGTIKILVRRPRPEAPGLHIYHPHGDFTFPSGHVFSYVMVFGIVAYLVVQALRSPALRAALLVVLISLIVLVGPVRLYLGEHWLIDVVAGYLLGGLGLYWMTTLYLWGKPKFFARHT
jgi:membrane-associated phospholipid phosphatase